MKKNIYTVGTVALALVMSGLPALALAERNGGEGQGEVSAQVKVQTLGTTAVGAGVTAKVSEDQKQEEGRQTQQSSFGEKQNLEASSTNEQNNNEDVRGEEKEAVEAPEAPEIDLELENDQDVAISNDDLNQKLEKRKQQLDQEVASSSPEHQAIVANANEVRLAVHALLASKDLIGGIGQQVSEIAKEVDHSVASTTNAEAKIQSRGFLMRLLFGGDTTSAEVIAQEAAQNQARIDSLTALLGQANISADVQATLTAQITALQDAQARLQNLAEKEKSAWGLFSWRF